MKGNLKKTISVFILVVLTLAAFDVLTAPGVRADSPEAKILNYTWYVAPAGTVISEYIGDLVAVGEAQNVGSNTIGLLYVTGVAYDSTGTVLGSNEVQVFSNNLLPGQKAPFYIDFPPETSVSQDQSWVANVTNVVVSVGYVSHTNVTQNSGLVISEGTSYVDPSGTYTVAGYVQNSGSETAGYVLVVTTFYNASGNVVSLNYTNYLSTSLSPGASVPFIATPTDNSALLSSEITNYSLLIQSQPVTTSATPTPTPTPSELPTSSPTASPPVTRQSFDSSILIYFGVGAVIVLVAVATLVFLRKRRNLPPPPPPEEQELPDSALELMIILYNLISGSTIPCLLQKIFNSSLTLND